MSMVRHIRTDRIHVSSKGKRRIDYAKVLVYEGSYEAGDQFPPILVEDCGGFYTIRDGRHRFLAQYGLGWQYVEAEVYQERGKGE